MSDFLAGANLLLIGLAILAVLLIFWGIAVYNRLAKARNGSKEALQGIDVALETRFDQVKAQADAVSGAVKKEVEVILGATALRTGRSIRDLDIDEKTTLNTALGDAQQKLLSQARGATNVPGAVASFEEYPEMNTRHNVEILQRTINEVEERLQAARRVYNRAATEYNNLRQVFPTVLVARILGFSDHKLFELTEARKQSQYNMEGFLD